MREALIVAVLTFAGLTAWATLINFAVKAVFDFIDRQSAVPPSHSGARGTGTVPSKQEASLTALDACLAIRPDPRITSRFADHGLAKG